MKSAFNEIGTTGIQGGSAIADAALVGNQLATETLNTFVGMAGTAVDTMNFQKMSAAALDDVNKNTRALVSLPDQLGLVQAELQSVNINLIKGLVIDDGSIGGKALSAFVDGDTNISRQLADQLKNATNNLLNPENKDAFDIGDNLTGSGVSANFGTEGFQNFGSGTRATLHGSEMVLPERNVGELADKLASAIASMTMSNTTNNNTNTTAGDNVTNNAASIDMTTLNTNTTELIDLNKKLANHLNTLITIGAMTEKNTKNFNNNLANMSGSLV